MLSPLQFKQALEKGLGRAWLHINQEEITKEYLEILIQACLTSWVFDSQCEGGRADWLFSIIQMTEHKKEIEDIVLATLITDSNSQKPGSTWDLQQLLDLASEFADRGSFKARKTIYSWFDQSKHNESWLGGEQIIALDGLEGFLHVVEKIGAKLKSDPDFWEDEYMLVDIKERFGKDRVLRALNDKARLSENVSEYLNHIKTRISSSPPTETLRDRIRKSITLDHILQDIDTDKRDFTYFDFRYFGKFATEDEIKILWTQLLKENRNPQILKLLWVFEERMLDQVPDKIILLAHSNLEELQEAAVSVLENTSHDKIHNLSKKFLTSTSIDKISQGLKLLRNNFRPDDQQIIEEILTRIPLEIEPDDIHTLVCDVLDLIESNQENRRMKLALQWCYENSPCSVCREKAIKELLDQNAFPSKWILECKHDGRDEIRKMFIE